MTILDAQAAFKELYKSGAPSATLLFSHPELWRDISNKGLPIVSLAPFSQQTHDQLNQRWDFTTVAEYFHKAPPYAVVGSGDVLNYITCVMKLTHGKLLCQDNWSAWQTSEFLQPDQYDAQNMSGSPTAVESNEAVFPLVWSYGIKAVDGRKKARCTCDGLHDQAKFVFSTRHMLTVSTRLVLVCSMGSRRLRTYSFMGRMSQMPSRRLLHLNRGFISGLIRLFMIGGQSISNVL